MMNCLPVTNQQQHQQRQPTTPIKDHSSVVRFQPTVVTGRTKPRSVQIKHKFGRLGQGSGQLSSPHGFCLGANEEVIIADTFNHRICIFEKTGQFKHQFGNQGKEEGELWYPRKVSVIVLIVIRTLVVVVHFKQSSFFLQIKFRSLVVAK